MNGSWLASNAHTVSTTNQTAPNTHPTRGDLRGMADAVSTGVSGVSTAVMVEPSCQHSSVANSRVDDRIRQIDQQVGE